MRQRDGVCSAVQLLPSEAAREFRFDNFAALGLCVVGGVGYMDEGKLRKK